MVDGKRAGESHFLDSSSFEPISLPSFQSSWDSWLLFTLIEIQAKIQQQQNPLGAKHHSALKYVKNGMVTHAI